MDIIYINNIRMGSIMIGLDRWGNFKPQFVCITLQLHVPFSKSMKLEESLGSVDHRLAWDYIVDGYHKSSQKFPSLLDFTEFIAETVLMKYEGQVAAVRAIAEAPDYFMHAEKFTATVLRDMLFMKHEQSVIIHNVRAKTFIGANAEEGQKQSILATIDIDFKPTAVKLRDMDWKYFQNILVESIEKHSFLSMENLTDSISNFVWKNNLLPPDAHIRIRAEKQGESNGIFISRDATSFEKPGGSG